MSDNGGIKVTKKRGFTIVYNDMLPDGGVISARAWGVYVYLLSRPDGWECRVHHLKTVFTDGRDSIYSALRELVDAGLMGKETYLDNGLRRSRYTLDADGQTRRSAPDTGSPDVGGPDTGRPGEVSTEVTTTEVINDDSLRSSSSDNSTKPPRRRTRIPDDFEVDDKAKDWFRRKGYIGIIDPLVETEKFKMHHKAKGAPMLDWQDAWRTWILNCATRSTNGNGRATNKHHAPRTPEMTARDEQLKALWEGNA
jgi:hypothetical protein